MRRYGHLADDKWYAHAIEKANLAEIVLMGNKFKPQMF